MTDLSSNLYERYRERLSFLADDTILRDAIATAGFVTSWWRPEQRWKRRYGRFRPGEAAFAIFVFETREEPQELCQIEVYGAPFNDNLGQRRWQGESAAGPLRITRFPNDAAMPMLAATLAQPGNPKVVRYRPGRRCTIRFEELNNGGCGYAKIFADDSGGRVHADGVALWEGAGRGAFDFDVARPIDWDPESRTLWQERVAGVPVKDRLFAAGGSALGERMGRALGSLARSALKPTLLFDAEVQLDRTHRYARELVRRLPHLADRVEALLERIAAVHRSATQRELVPIHGAPHVHQWLVDGERVGLVDFDRFSFGDAELDVATFIAETDFEDPALVPVNAINNAFIAGYEATAGRVDRQLLAAYRAHKRFAMACHAAQAPRVDGDRRAERRLQRVFECLE